VASNDVTVVDIAAGVVVGHVPVGLRPYAVGLAGTHGFATDQYSGTVTAFDLGTLAPIKAIKACDYPEGIEADQSGRHLYVACWGDNILVRIDAQDLAISGKATVGDGPRAFGKFLR
jgi:DNA-binding beta-propeller fold protein YncE